MEIFSREWLAWVTIIGCGIVMADLIRWAAGLIAGSRRP